MKVSVVIATFRGAERLKRLLPTIRTCDPVGPGKPVDVETIVFDDGSPQSDAEAIARVVMAEGGIPMRHPSNRGYAACVRDAVAASTGEVVLLLDDDTQLPDGFFAVLRGLMEGLPGVGVLSWRSRGTNPGQSQHPVPGLLQQATQLASYCYAFRRAVWDEVGGFDTRFRFYCIDSDLCVRATLAGHPCYRVWWPLVPHDEHGGAVDTVTFDRGDVGRSDVALFEAKWGASGDEMERRALAGLPQRADR